MNADKEYLRRRREFLVSQAAAQRSEVAYIVSSLQPHLRLADTAFAVARSAYVVPVLAVAGALLMWRAPGKKIWSWGGRLFAAWRLFSLAQRRWSE